MPIYEYRCESCDQKSSFFTRSVNATVDAVCPNCDGTHMRRVISTVSFRMGSRSSSERDYYGDRSNIGRRTENAFKRHGLGVPEPVRKSIDDARQGKMPNGLDI